MAAVKAPSNGVVTGAEAAVAAKNAGGIPNIPPLLRLVAANCKSWGQLYGGAKWNRGDGVN